MERIEDFVARHHTLLVDNATAEGLYGFTLDAGEWHIEMPFHKFVDGSTLTLRVIVIDVGQTLPLMEYRFVYQTDDRVTLFNKVLPFGEEPDTRRDLRQTLINLGFNESLVEAVEVSEALQYIASLFFELQDRAQFLRFYDPSASMATQTQHGGSAT